MSMRFEWDENKNRLNAEKHGISFAEAVEVFADPDGFAEFNAAHSQNERRYFFYGKTKAGKILTVRFTYRGDNFRIIGAGEWEGGKKIYEKTQKNK